MNRPDAEYFHRCFARIPDFDLAKTMIVGDSLSSDIKGGINAGIATVWVNPSHAACGDIQPDYEIEALHQLEELLERSEISLGAADMAAAARAACKAAIKAGWHTDQRELLVLAKEVMAREDLKYCPHGRPICITLSKKQLEKQFKRV